jgi:hypothetical protein
VPGFVYLPNRLGHLQSYSTKLDRPGQYAGWLGRGYDPLATAIGKRDDKDNPYFRDCDDDELNFQIEGLALGEGLSLDRLERRRSLVAQFDASRRELDRSRLETSYDQFRQRALSLVSSEKVRRALDIRQEPAATRDRYGRHLFGQATLMARRLVEAGTRFVTVAWDAPDGYSWDSHTHSNDVRDYLIPGLDQALASLLGDLESAGYWTRRWSLRLVRWAARPSEPTINGAVAIGARCSRPYWPARACVVEWSTAPAIGTPPMRSIRRPAPRIWRPPFSTAWGSIRNSVSPTPRAGRCRWSMADVSCRKSYRDR